jgi:DNA modification methylase
VTVQILTGDVREMLATLPAESVQCVVTSPPYFQLRDYGVPGQIGMEATPAEFIATLVSVFAAVRRVLRPDGVCFVNLGDSYAGSGKGPTGHNGIGDQEQRQGFRTGNPSRYKDGKSPSNRDGLGAVAGVKPKSLMLIPERFAIAMQEPRHVGPIKREADRAWLAALIDADGCLSARKFHPAEYKKKGWNPGYIPFLAVSQADVQALEHCVKITGLGSVIAKSLPSEDPRGIAGIHGRRPMYTWRLDGAQVGAILRDIYPYLLIKKQQAKVLYALVQSVGQQRSSRSQPVSPSVIEERHRLFECVKLLNQRSPVDLPSLADPPSSTEPGWIVRSRIAWCKKSAMPESVRDRPTSAWEHIWMFTRHGRYFWDQEAVRQPNTDLTIARHANAPASRYTEHRSVGTIPPGHPAGANPLHHHSGSINVNGGGVNGANLRNYWLLGPEPSREEHYAAFPSEIPRRCILAASRKGDTVLDPFLGTGTTALVADRLERNAIGVELNPKYVEIARRRIESDAGMFADVEMTAAREPAREPAQIPLAEAAS